MTCNFVINSYCSPCCTARSPCRLFAATGGAVERAEHARCHHWRRLPWGADPVLHHFLDRWVCKKEARAAIFGIRSSVLRSQSTCRVGGSLGTRTCREAQTKEHPPSVQQCFQGELFWLSLCHVPLMFAYMRLQDRSSTVSPSTMWNCVLQATTESQNMVQQPGVALV